MEPAVINEQIFTQLLEDVGEDMLPVLVAVFNEESSERILYLQDLVENIDTQKVAQSCHSIKSSAGTYGALIVQQHAEELEQMAKTENTDDVKGKLLALIGSLQDAIKALTLKCD